MKKKEENTRPEKKKKKTGAAAGGLALAGLLALALRFGLPGFGLGGGNGAGFGAGAGLGASSPDAAAVFSPSSVSSASPSSAAVSSAPLSLSAPAPDEAPSAPPISVIRIEGNEIFFDDAPCADENELRDLILPFGADRTYEFYYDNAIKGTYDKVRTVLTELQEALGFTILEP
ncbi:MAG: hypothetical protein HDT27_02795 [Subdoligranulum sp.]|nr:hypothetical protein [Subdoligranulum sp.]